MNPLAHKDLLFDLCTSLLNDDLLARRTFDDIALELQKTKPTERFVAYERAWYFKVARQHILKAEIALDRPTTSDQIELDALTAPSNRLKHFTAFFLRLSVDDKILLLLRDKFGLPYSELAICFGISEDTLKTRRGQALRTLEEWIWSDR